MKKKLFLIAALAVAAAVAAWYVLRMDQGDGMAYLTEPVTIGNITRTVNATGEVGAVQLVSVGAQVGGQIKKLHVVLGQDVKKGDLIAEIYSVPHGQGPAPVLRIAACRQKGGPEDRQNQV